MLHAVSERPANPGLEAWMIIGHVAAPWEPTSKKPLKCTQLEFKSAAYFHFCNRHGRKAEPTNLSFRHEPIGFDRRVVLAVHESDNLRVVPLVTKPLAIG